MPIRKDTTLLQMALAGYEVELQKIQQKIAEIEADLGKRTRGSAQATGTRRQMSAAARRRIATAQKKRWAEYRKRHKAA